MSLQSLETNNKYKDIDYCRIAMQEYIKGQQFKEYNLSNIQINENIPELQTLLEVFNQDKEITLDNGCFYLDGKEEFYFSEEKQNFLVHLLYESVTKNQDIKFSQKNLFKYQPKEEKLAITNIPYFTSNQILIEAQQGFNKDEKENILKEIERNIIKLFRVQLQSESSPLWVTGNSELEDLVVGTDTIVKNICQKIFHSRQPDENNQLKQIYKLKDIEATQTNTTAELTNIDKKLDLHKQELAGQLASHEEQLVNKLESHKNELAEKLEVIKNEQASKQDAQEKGTNLILEILSDILKKGIGQDIDHEVAIAKINEYTKGKIDAHQN